MAKNPVLEAVQSELVKANVPFIFDTKDSRVKWVSPQGAEREFQIATNLGDWRGTLNAKLDVRRMLVADGYLDENLEAKMQKFVDQYTARFDKLQGDAEALLDLAQQETADLRQRIEILERRLAEQDTITKRKKERSSTSIVLAALNADYQTIGKLAQEVKLPYDAVKAELAQLAEAGAAEFSMSMGYRKKAASTAATNGVHEQIIEGHLVKIRREPETVQGRRSSIKTTVQRKRSFQELRT